MIEERMINF